MGAEGLTLTRSDLQSGFRNVYVTHNKKTAVPRKGAGRRQACLPWLYFKTAGEKALHVARTPEGQTAAALPPPMTAKGAGQAAAALAAAADDSEGRRAGQAAAARPPPMTAKGALAQAQRRRGCALLASALASALDLQSTVSGKSLGHQLYPTPPWVSIGTSQRDAKACSTLACPHSSYQERTVDRVVCGYLLDYALLTYLMCV